MAEIVDDRGIEEAVKQALLYDRRLSSQPIHVAVKDAVVSLRSAVQFHSRALGGL